MASSSSLGIRCGGSILKSSIVSESSSPSCSLHFQNHHHLKFNQKQRITAQGCSISNNHQNNSRRAIMSNSSASSNTTAYLDTVFGTEMEKNQQDIAAATSLVREIKVGVYGGEDEEEQKKKNGPPQISADKLDEWMTFSVPEIVKNIGDAPLLVHIYSSISKGVGGMSSIGGGSSSTPAEPILEKTKAEPESWNGVTKRWEEGSPVPDGIILVEQLKAEDEEGDEVIPASDISGSSSSTKTWGVVIQGRGIESASSCYILKTCRVGSSLGFCTHFCLARAKCFGESADLQLKNSWLLGH